MRSGALIGILALWLVCGYAATEKKPLASQAELNALIDRADTLEVKESWRKDAPTLFVSKNPVDREDLKKALVIDEKRSTSICLCMGTTLIILFRDGKEFGRISNQHCDAVRYTGSHADAVLTDREKFFQWCDARGIKGPRQEWEKQQQTANKERMSREKWIKATPACLLQLAVPKSGIVAYIPKKGSFPHPEKNDAKITRMFEAMQKNYADPQDAAAALFAWYGNGEKWSGYPEYEDAAAQLLYRYPAALIVKVATEKSLTDSQMEGFLRFYCCTELYLKQPPSSDLRRKIEGYWDKTSSGKDDYRRERGQRMLNPEGKK